MGHYVWIRTEARVPYLVLEGDIDPPTEQAAMDALLRVAYRRVENVYNAPAYAIDEACQHVFCLKDSAHGAIALFSLDSADARDRSPLLALDEVVSAYVSGLNEVLGRSGSVHFQPRRAKIQVSDAL